MKWDKKYLADVADFCLGKMLDQKKNRGDFLPYLANLNVQWGEFDLTDLRQMKFESHEIERYGLKYGDIVMCEGGEPGRCAIWQDQMPGMMIQKALHRIRPHACLDHRFLFYFFLLKGRMGGFSPLFTGSTIKHLPRQNLAKVEIDVPPLEIQNKIADILSKYDETIANNRRRIELLERSSRLLYREWFVHLRYPGHEHGAIDPDGIPEGWKKGTISDFYQTTSGGTPSRKNPDFFTGDINWVKTQELNEDYIFETEEKITEDAVIQSSAKIFPENTLLVSIYGGTNIGRTAILATPSSTNQACVAIIPNHELANPIYAQLFFYFKRQYLIGIAQGSAQTNISQNTLKQVEFLMPSCQIMSLFLDYATQLFDQKKTLQLQNQKLQAARDLLLPRLMNGEINV